MSSYESQWPGLAWKKGGGGIAEEVGESLKLVQSRGSSSFQAS